MSISALLGGAALCFLAILITIGLMAGARGSGWSIQDLLIKFCGVFWLPAVGGLGCAFLVFLIASQWLHHKVKVQRRLAEAKPVTQWFMHASSPVGPPTSMYAHQKDPDKFSFTYSPIDGKRPAGGNTLERIRTFVKHKAWFTPNLGESKEEGKSQMHPVPGTENFHIGMQFFAARTNVRAALLLTRISQKL